MIKTTTWRPDTCGCEIEYQWDDTESEDKRIHTVSNVVNRCPAHQSDTVKEALFTKVLKENTNKNKVFADIVANVPELTNDVIQKDGSVVRELKSDALYKWSFDANRNLVVDISDFDVAVKSKLKTFIKLKEADGVIIKETK